MDNEQKVDTLLGAVGNFAQTHDAAAVGTFRESVAQGADTGALVFEEATADKDAMLSMKDRKDSDGKYEPGYLPLVWVNGNSRKVLGEIKASELLELIDTEIAKKKKPAN